MRSLDEAHWRDSARSIKFFIWDGKAVFPFVFALMYLRIWTLALAFLTMVFFTILNRYGFSISVFGRWLRSTFAGKRKITVPWWIQ